MKVSLKKIVTMFVFISLISVVLPLNCVYSDEQVVADDALAFIRDVAGIDVSQYSIKSNGPNVYYLPSHGGLPSKTVKYVLTSNESELGIIVTFIDEFLTSYKVYVYKGSPIYREQSSSILESATGVLERFENISKGSSPPEMIQLLNTLDYATPNMTLTSNNLKLHVSIEGNTGSINCVYFANGIEYDMKSIKMRFSDAHLTYYASGWSAYSIGEGKMNVTIDEAIAKSTERAQNHKLTFDGEEKEFTLATNKTNIQLYGVEREPLTLQLMWDVKIPFEQPIYSVYGLEVTLWADTGEIYSFGVLSAAGLPSGPSWSPPPETTNENPLDVISDDLPDDTNNEISPDMTPVLLVLAVVSSVLIAVAVFYKVRRTTSNNN
ncbi:MAG: hypothetical protein WC325_05795 [Candidatus Bathyarchaeia archaeon]|jgi:hypothetical protein